MKKLDVDKHTGPFLILILLGTLVLVGCIGFLAMLIIEPSVALVVTGVILIFAFPWWSAFLWNKFVADEEDYYD